MAGPGGGPPRKSHTKSRNGCRTCKKRHIRCDETFPQCRNCTKHNCRCDYMDVAAAREDANRSPGTPNLMMTPEIEMEIENWRRTGIPPFPELSQCPQNNWYQFSRTDLRLIHHIAGLSIDFHRRGLNNSTIWAPKMPCFLAIAMSSHFVMSSILAFSACHLAYMTGSKETENLFYHHRVVAIKGLQKAISSFSKENCDAILAASMLLSWQTTEWRSWASLQKGLSSVLDAMHPSWKEASELAHFLGGQRAFRTLGVAMTPGYLGTASRFQDNLERIDGALADLHTTWERVQHNGEYSSKITDLLGFVQKLRNDLPIESPEKAFERLQPLRMWLFWLPTKMLRGGEADISALAVLAQFFGTALVLEPIFPEIEGSYLGSMAVAPLEDIDRIVLSRNATHPYVPEVQLAASIMDFPRRVLADYKSRVQWGQQFRPMDHLIATPPSPYHGFTDIPFATSSPSTTSSTYTAYTSSIHSPPVLATPDSPFQPPNLYAHRPSFSHLYASSPLPSDHGDDAASLSDYSQPGTLAHSPAFSAPYVDDLPGGGFTGPDGSAGLGMGLLHESPMMPQGSVAPELWT
ncbi:hypothetical protein VTN96DRAFT_10180 [Rasamsonia emersonii]